VTSATIPLKRLADLNPETLGEETDPDRFFRYIDIATVGRGTLVDVPQLMTFAESPSRARRVLRPADTILSTVRTYLRAVWTVRGTDDDLVASTGFVCLRPRAGIDSRFLGWLVQSDVVVEEVVARSVGVSYPAVNPSEVGLIKVPCPRLATQRAIADYLDRETARIDALIAAKRQMVELLEERFVGQTSALLFCPKEYLPVRLKFICGPPTSGNRDHGSFTYTPDGIPCLRGIDLSKDYVDLSTVLRISAEDSQRHANTKLHAGDLVIVRSGATAGRSALVTRELDGSNCVDLVIVRKSPTLEPRYLAYVVRSREIQDRVLHESSGALQPHFNAVDAGEILVPMRSLDDQRRVLTILDDLALSKEQMVKALDRQTDLLQERRQALIRAAVTGQLDILEVA
jgi:type I restriction enzyme, S subunit